MFDDNESSASNLTTGAKIAILAAVPFILLGVYFLIAPITELRTTTGAVFGCGSTIGSPDDKFKSNICGSINTVYMPAQAMCFSADPRPKATLPTARTTLDQLAVSTDFTSLVSG